MDKEHEEQMINNFRSEMEAKIKEKEREQKEEKNEKIKGKKAEEAIFNSSLFSMILHSLHTY